jgi:hypothetical protein
VCGSNGAPPKKKSNRNESRIPVPHGKLGLKSASPSVGYIASSLDAKLAMDSEKLSAWDSLVGGFADH